MRTVIEEIESASESICESIRIFPICERDSMSRKIIGDLRHLVEHVSVLTCYGIISQDDYYTLIENANKKVKQLAKLRFLGEFHDLLQKVVSHYVPKKEASERLMLKYFEYLIRIKRFVEDEYGINILDNLDDFPLVVDPGLSEYYEKIAEKVERFDYGTTVESQAKRFYVQRVKPFFVNMQVYYEITLAPAHDRVSKFDRMIAFSKRRIPENYAVSLAFKNSSIEMLGYFMPILIVQGWRTSIRPCELNGISKILGLPPSVRGNQNDYRELMSFLTEVRMSINELVASPDDYYSAVRSKIEASSNSRSIVSILDISREVIKQSGPGSNVIRYLIFRPRNRVIIAQYDCRKNNWLSWLNLKNQCLPFEQIPFNTALCEHNPSVRDLMGCIEYNDRGDELLARHVSNNAEVNGVLYTDVKELEHFGTIETYIKLYNAKLYKGHSHRKLICETGHVFVKEHEDDVAYILGALKELASSGVAGHRAAFEYWISQNRGTIDDETKINALMTMFENSHVALVYGSAGTGKTTLIKHIANYYSQRSKLFLANTNPAVDNLRRKVHSPQDDFQTITSFLYSQSLSRHYDLVVVDECSTVCNRHMRMILEKADYDLLVLVGDVKQIESIRFGNWFDLAEAFVPQHCIFEFCVPYRTTKKYLTDLWSSVRLMNPDVMELLENNDISSRIDDSLFRKEMDDEIILCLNYDGLYGINNVNRFLQAANENKPFIWDGLVYKVGDPILFNDSNRFSPLLYNNLKGVIERIELNEDYARFVIRLDLVIDELAVRQHEGLEYVGSSPSGNALVGFCVQEFNDYDDENGQTPLNAVMPFQIAYAVSVHKAQGLEYDSVKLIITNEVEENVTHNIFYTAVTRAREKLRIFWTPETENNVIRNMETGSRNKDACLLSHRRNIPLNR